MARKAESAYDLAVYRKRLPTLATMQTPAYSESKVPKKNHYGEKKEREMPFLS